MSLLFAMVVSAVIALQAAHSYVQEKRLQALKRQLDDLERRLYPSPDESRELLRQALKARPGSVSLSPALREALARSVRQFDE